jgi:hypothetical protein
MGGLSTVIFAHAYSAQDHDGGADAGHDHAKYEHANGKSLFHSDSPLFD